MRRITDMARLNWLAENKAEISYQSSKVGPGWVREEKWFVVIDQFNAGSGTDLRQAIDAAMSRELNEGQPK